MENACLDNADKKRLEFFNHQYAIFKEAFANKFGYSGEGVCFMDSTSYFDEVSETIFFDTCHVSDKGYEIWSKKLFDELNSIGFFNK